MDKIFGKARGADLVHVGGVHPCRRGSYAIAAWCSQLLTAATMYGHCVDNLKLLTPTEHTVP